MSVSLTPINNPEGASYADLSNSTWSILTNTAQIPWDGTHDEHVYTPEQLRSIAKVIPKEWSDYGWTESLEELAKLGGAILT